MCICQVSYLVMLNRAAIVRIMQFYRGDKSIGAKQLSNQVGQSLDQGKKVLWLVSGGSNIPIAVEVMTALYSHSLENLTIMLSDERYGAIGHPDSNSQQLESAGFKPKGAAFIPVLINKPLSATTAHYTSVVAKELKQNQVIIGQLGIGADGHIAGILPNSPAADVSDALVIGYTAKDFGRITLTFPALRHLNSAFVFAYGADKQTTLAQLKDEEISIKTQPAQILKAIQQTYIYNDELEGMA